MHHRVHPLEEAAEVVPVAQIATAHLALVPSRQPAGIAAGRDGQDVILRPVRGQFHQHMTPHKPVRACYQYLFHDPLHFAHTPHRKNNTYV